MLVNLRVSLSLQLFVPIVLFFKTIFFIPRSFFPENNFPSNTLPQKRPGRIEQRKKQTSSTDLRTVRPQDGASFQLRLLGLLHQVVPEKCKVPAALRNVGFGCDQADFVISPNF